MSLVEKYLKYTKQRRHRNPNDKKAANLCLIITNLIIDNLSLLTKPYMKLEMYIADEYGHSDENYDLDLLLYNNAQEYIIDLQFIRNSLQKLIETIDNIEWSVIDAYYTGCKVQLIRTIKKLKSHPEHGTFYKALIYLELCDYEIEQIKPTLSKNQPLERDYLSNFINLTA